MKKLLIKFSNKNYLYYVKNFMKKITPLFILIIAAMGFVGCDASKEIELTGDRAYEQKQYIIATKLLQDELKTCEKNEVKDKTLKIAQSFDAANKNADAAKWYQSYFELSNEPAYFYKFIEKQKSTNNYQQCVDDLNEFIKNNPSEKIKAAYEIQQCSDAEQWLTLKSMYQLKKIDSINTIRNEYAPVAYEKSKLVFTSDRVAATGEEKYGWTGEKYSDLFYAEIKSGKFARPKKFSTVINTAVHEGTCTFTRNFSAIIFTRCGSENSTDDFCQLYISERQNDGEWGDAVRLFLFGAEDTLQNIGQPFLTEDGKSLYFSSDNAGGFGGKDLYVCSKTNAGWGKPRNLGATINSNGDDVFPYVRKDGTLFFSSNGHGGMGGLDIFMCMKNGNKYGQPFNLKSPLNSGADDLGFSFVQFESKNLPDTLQGWGYFSSNRVGGKGGDDIYKFELKKEKVITYWLNGAISENKYEDESNPKSKIMDTLFVQKAIVQLYEINKQNGMQHLVDADTTDANGDYMFQIENNKTYKIVVSKNGYFNKSDNVSSKNVAPKSDENKVFVYKDVRLEKIFKDKQIEIPNIFYDVDKSNIRADAAAVLDSLVLPILLENPTLQFELGSHTDARGNDDYNLALSQKRADAVVDYLISKSITRDRLIAKGYGETQIINRCLNDVDCSDEEHQQNRRTTFKVIEK
jgi:outer membrane protein OmpA-like peptidoglycan-associated protein